ncbi:hypothetical protein AAFF_G00235700 [Aldrovandia affinis]|uniref:Uncharacterized protein n=1 Tax=Aldrovandia affinis TaxID=143900 RepID=A0AAD7SWB4_9TELE|nr:hypothetical protein AAFF_G00235700 [Aldrovandia affinis]
MGPGWTVHSGLARRGVLRGWLGRGGEGGKETLHTAPIDRDTPHLPEGVLGVGHRLRGQRPAPEVAGQPLPCWVMEEQQEVWPEPGADVRGTHTGVRMEGRRGGGVAQRAAVFPLRTPEEPRDATRK